MKRLASLGVELLVSCLKLRFMVMLGACVFVLI